MIVLEEEALTKFSSRGKEGSIPEQLLALTTARLSLPTTFNFSALCPLHLKFQMDLLLCKNLQEQ